MENLEKNENECLTWHAPKIRRLDVSLDTKNGLGSGNDASGHTPCPCV